MDVFIGHIFHQAKDFAACAVHSRVNNKIAVPEGTAAEF
jgi:hypothetical protein